jgi:hypothetical protein
MSTQAAAAWMILNDADAIEQKIIATMNRVFGDHANRDMFMSQMVQTSALHAALMNVTGGFQLEKTVENFIYHTMQSAEVMIQDDFRRAYGPPRIAVRFQTPNGQSFIVHPKVML